jgi:MinD-like ATPase involved in chromosome partitioning or flagellar assembly
MFTAVIISSNSVWGKIVQELAIETGLVLPYRLLLEFPSPYEFVQLMNRVRPEVLFLDLGNLERIAEYAQVVASDYPETVLIGFGDSPQPLERSEFGLAAVLGPSLDAEGFVHVIDHAIHDVRGGVQHNLFAFLPSKAGSGCSTVALHTAGMLVQSYKKRVLVIEADLRSGALSILLNFSPEWSMQKALNATAEFDAFRVKQCIASKHGVDFLLSTNTTGAQLPTWTQYFQLLEAVRENYDFILVDLPELINPATVEIVRRAEAVFTVTTPEVPNLKLAQLRCKELWDRAVPPERMAFVLNRSNSNAASMRDVEHFLKLPVRGVIPNDYAAIQTAALEGKCLPPRKNIGRAFVEFAGSLGNLNPPQNLLKRVPLQFRRMFQIGSAS